MKNVVDDEQVQQMIKNFEELQEAVYRLEVFVMQGSHSKSKRLRTQITWKFDKLEERVIDLKDLFDNFLNQMNLNQKKPLS